MISILFFQAASGGPSAKMISTAHGALLKMRSDWKSREAAAEAAANRFLSGGNLWIAGSIPLFDVEWTNRSGGLMPAAALKNIDNLTSADVLVYGSMMGSESDDLRFLGQARAKGALIVVFGTGARSSSLRVSADFFLAADLPSDTPLAAQIAACVNVAHLWAFTGDLVAACTREGRMPTMWQSIKVPGSTERNRRIRPLKFHEPLPVGPVKPGVLGNDYLSGLSSSLKKLDTEVGSIRDAGQIIRRAVESKHAVFHANLGHFEPARLLPPGFPIPLTILPAKEPEAEIRKTGTSGDALFIIWYHEMPTPLLAAAQDQGIRSICLAATNPFAPLDTSPADVYIDPQWVVGDALVEVPGYDVRILPPSAVLNSLVFFAVLSEALPSR
jgi:hypothetical protein